MGKGRSRRKRHQKKLKRHEEKMIEVLGTNHPSIPFTQERIKELLKKSADGANKLHKQLKQ